MFDLIKHLLGHATCWNCKFRRFWGLYCGCKRPRNGFPRSAWQKYGCWFYVDEVKNGRPWYV